LIHRNPTGSLWLTDTGYVTDLSTNIGGVKTKGVDFTANYSHDIGKLGSLSLGIIGTYLKSLTTDNGLSTPYNCAGYFGKQCGTPNPKWRGKARLTYASPDGVGLSVQWRYFGPVDVVVQQPYQRSELFRSCLDVPCRRQVHSPFGREQRAR
jgi:iron complex outermembrane receptor protein